MRETSTRSGWAPHVTVAAIAERGQRFLLVEELSRRRHVLNQPAGHLEDNETLLDAVVREVREETACVFRPHYIVGIYRWRNAGDGKTHLRVTFYGEVISELPDSVLDDGIVAAHWLSYEEIASRDAEHRSPLVLKCLDDYRAGRRYDLDLIHDVF